MSSACALFARRKYLRGGITWHCRCVQVKCLTMLSAYDSARAAMYRNDNLKAFVKELQVGQVLGGDGAAFF